MWGSVLLWGCFAAAGSENLDHVTGVMDSFKYQAIFAKIMMPLIHKLKLHWIITLSRTRIPSIHSNLPKLGLGFCEI